MKESAINNTFLSKRRGYSHLAAGICTGGCSIGAGYAVGVSGNYGTKSLARKPQNFVGFVLIWAWAQVNVKSVEYKCKVATVAAARLVRSSRLSSHHEMIQQLPAFAT